jgi:hypothetical protein
MLATGRTYTTQIRTRNFLWLPSPLPPARRAFIVRLLTIAALVGLSLAYAYVMLVLIREFTPGQS